MAAPEFKRLATTPPQDEDRTSCAVCGFKGIDRDKHQQPEVSPMQYVVVGNTYNAHDLTNINLTVTPTVPAWGACPFCGSPRWSDGSPGDLR